MRDILIIYGSPEPTPAERLSEALGLETRLTAEIQDMYHRPIETGGSAEDAREDLAA